MRKLIALLLALALMLGLTSTAFAKAKTLEIYWIANAAKGDADTWMPIKEGVEQAINEYIEPLINANVNFHLVNWDDWETDALQPLLDGEKIDLIFTADWRDYVQEINAGALLPLENLLDDYGQGITENLSEDFLEGVKYGPYIYGIPTNKELCVPSGILVNKTAAKEIGWDVDAYKETGITTEELEPWLEAYKKLYPDNYPYLMEKGRWADEPWIHEWIGLAEDVLDMKYATDENGAADETIYSIFETPEQEAHIRLMYDWAKKGYIDPDADTYSYNAIFGSGNFLVFTQPLKGHDIKAVEMAEANGAEFECTEIVMQEKCLVTCQAGGSMFAIPAKAKHKDLAMQYLNLMHSDETLVNLMLFGKEGVNYTKVNDRQVELIKTANWYGLHGGAWTVGNTKLQYVLTSEDPEKNALLQQYADEEPKAVKTISYGFRFDKSKAKDLIKKVEDVANEYARGLMVGKVNPDDPEKGLAAFVSALKAAGIDELKAEVERQFKEWQESLK